jgi:thiol-disulfide isomerase/thioredoxin
MRRSARSNVVQSLCLSLVLWSLAGCTVDEPVEEPTAPPPVVVLTPPKADPAKLKATLEEGSAPPLIAAPAKPNESIEALLSQSEKADESGDPNAAVRFVERALQIAPKDRRALLLSARLHQGMAPQFPRPFNTKLYLKSAELMRTLVATYPTLNDDEKRILGSVYYNEACSHAVNGEPDKAIAVLKEACDAGINDLAHMDMDEELDSLRKTPEFRELMKRLELKQVEAMRAATKPYPFDFKLNDFDGKPYALADWKGKVVIVDFWGTWCPPCRKDIPHLNALYKKYHDKGLEIVGLTYEQGVGESAATAVRRFMTELSMPYPCLVGDTATQKSVPNFEGFPTLLFIDREGKVRLQVTGYQPFGALEAAVTSLLGPEPAKDEAHATKPAPK